MNIFRKITWETMKKNRTRTIVTIIGVILSATLFTALTVFCISLFSFVEKTYMYQSGDYHIAAESISQKTAKECGADPDTEKMAVAVYRGYAGIESENPDKPYLYVEAADDAFFSMMPVHLTSGELPTQENEILLPAHLYYNGMVQYEIGDQLTLELGDRGWNENTVNDSGREDDTVSETDDTVRGNDDTAGAPASESYLKQNNAYTEGEEKLVNQETKTYTVTGFYERPNFENYSAPGYTALTYLEHTNVREEKADSYSVYVRLIHPRKTMDRFIAEYHLETSSLSVNDDMLMFSGVFKFGNFSRFFGGLVAFFIVLIFAGSVSLIYSAFSISVSERTKQFGLLSSIGATKRQIRRLVWQESFIVSCMGIPLGIVVGIVGMGITLHFVGSKFTSLLSSPYSVTLQISWSSILIAAVIALLTVLVSALIPSARATRVTAIEAIRQSADVTTKGKDVRTGKRFLKTFGLEGMLGKKYFKRSRKKYRATVISLAFSVILFIASSGYGMYLKASVSGSVYTSNYDVSYVGYDTDKELPVEELRNADGVREMAYSADRCIEVMPEESQTSDSYRQYVKRCRDDCQKYGGNEEDIVPKKVKDRYSWITARFYLDDVSYEKFVREQGLDEDIYLKGKDVPAIVCNSGNAVSWLPDQRISYEFDYFQEGVTSVQRVKDVPEMEGYTYLTTNWCSRDQISVEKMSSETEDSEEGILESESPDSAEDEIFCYQYIKDGVKEEYDNYGNVLNAYNVPVETEELLLGDFVSECPLGVSDSDTLTLIYPYRMITEEDYKYVTCYFNVDHHDTMLTSVKEILREHGHPDSEEYFNDRLAAEESDRDMLLVMNVFSYGFIILISLISIANVFNTISTNVALRRRDFAMLKSVGMTQKGIHKMMNYECLMYGSRALMWGLPIGFLLNILLYRITHSIYDGGFRLPWSAYIIAVVCVFVVVFVTMLYAMRKIEKDSPIDALKNENM